MSIGSWTPDSANDSDNTIDRSFLQRAISIVSEHDSLADSLTEQEKSGYSIMHCDEQLWSEALADFNSEQLVQLIKFFALAEMQLPGWQAGENSPVIAINRYLKTRGDKLDKSMLLWLRENSSNRFIPNGALKL